MKIILTPIEEVILEKLLKGEIVGNLTYTINESIIDRCLKEHGKCLGIGHTDVVKWKEVTERWVALEEGKHEEFTINGKKVMFHAVRW
ncbi:MAG TPA: hypothetical protein VI911_08595 [Patescibacteria group bacterium]|nr:MAG: hypothetical protein UR43_C0005G0114 [candidate division TM6 bacterium GW2011_GWF2_33_332]HLD91054.1 hypothetical protein [Patescibacteria group bacterium]